MGDQTFTGSPPTGHLTDDASLRDPSELRALVKSTSDSSRIGIGANGRLAMDSLPLTGEYTTYAVQKAASGSGWATGSRPTTAPFPASRQHTGTEVRIAASGPQAANVLGITNQADLFFTFKRALGLG